jgi:hypothetical protein
MTGQQQGKSNPFAQCSSYQSRREVLKQLSQEAKKKQRAMKKAGSPIIPRVNDFLEVMYGGREFYTFGQIRKNGWKLRKGSKCYCLWSKPIKRQDKEEKQAESQGLISSRPDQEFYGIVYVFSDLQVIK